jgi:hypothetical protein
MSARLIPYNVFLEKRRAELAVMAVHWIHPGGTLDLAPNLARFTVEGVAELHDVTPANAADRQVLPGVRRGGAKLTLIASEGGVAEEAALQPGATGTLVYGRAGSAPGQPKRGFMACVRRFAETLTPDGVPAFEVEFEQTGAAVYGPGAVWE